MNDLQREELQEIESLDSNLEFYLVNNESSVNAPKFKVVNNSDEVQTVKLYVAGYSDGVLKKINFTDVSIAQDDIQYLSAEIDKDDTVSDYKYFIWDNNNTPKTNCISING